MLLNLLQLLQSDDQVTYTDKVNYNFDQILSMGGGPIGPTGFKGIQGVPGSQGIQGFQGIPGIDGLKWYVQPSANIPVIPVPKYGDFWLQTDTLEVWSYIGSPASWISLGYTLSAPGVFTQGGINNLVFTNASALRSLVLSPINYGISNDSPGTPNYRLKIVGTSGSPMLRFGIDDGGIENIQTYQPTIGVQKINDGFYPAGLNWQWNFDNVNGDIAFNLAGNNFKIYPQIATVSRFDFGAQVRLQSNAADRLLSFAFSNAGTEFFHIGRHTGISTVTDKLFSIKDNGQISFGNSSQGDAFTFPSGANDYHIDSLNDDLDALATSSINWFRLRGRVATGGGSTDGLVINHNRLFADGGSPLQRSTMIRLQHTVDSSSYHFVGFTGGVDTSGGTFRPQLRMGYINNYYFSGDVNGRIGIGDSAFIQKYNSTPYVFNSKLNIQGNLGPSGASTGGPNSFSGIHLIPKNFTNAVVGISAGGIGAFENMTFGGIHFKDESSAPNQGLDLHITTGLYADGGATRRSTILRNGDHYWWSKTAPSTGFLYLEPGTWNGTPLDVNVIGAYDTGSSSWKDIIFNLGTDYTGFGNGFIGIGGDQGFGEQLVGFTSIPLSGQQYMCLTPVSCTITPFIGFAYSFIASVNDIFTSVTFPDTMTLDFGTISRVKPQTKLHVAAKEAVTFGTRLDGFYNSGQTSFTVGNNHSAVNTRNIILGGKSHITNANDAIIIGYNGGAGQTNSTANSISLASHTSITVSPTPRFLRGFAITGDIADKKNTLNLTISGITGPNGFEMEVQYPLSLSSIGVPTQTSTPEPHPVLMQVTSRQDNGFGGYNYGTIFQVNGRGNASIGTNPFEVPQFLSLPSTGTYKVYETSSTERIFQSGLYQGWEFLANNSQWWFGGAQGGSGVTISRAALSIGGNGGIILNQHTANNPLTAKESPRLSLANLVINNAGSSYSYPLGLFGGILINKTTNTSSATKGANIEIVGGEAYMAAPGFIPAAGGLIKGGDVVIAGGRASYLQGTDYNDPNTLDDTFGCVPGHVILGLDPLSNCVRPNAQVKVYSQVQMMDPLPVSPPINAIAGLNTVARPGGGLTIINPTSYDRIITVFTFAGAGANINVQGLSQFIVGGVEVARMWQFPSTGYYQQCTIPLPANRSVAHYFSAGGGTLSYMQFTEVRMGLIGTACAVPVAPGGPP